MLADFMGWLKVTYFINSFCRILVEPCLALLLQRAADQNLLEVGNEITLLLQLLQYKYTKLCSQFWPNTNQNDVIFTALVAISYQLRFETWIYGNWLQEAKKSKNIRREGNNGQLISRQIFYVMGGSCLVKSKCIKCYDKKVGKITFATNNYF